MVLVWTSLMFVINRSLFVAWHFSMWNSICMQEIYSGIVRTTVLEWSVCSTGWGMQNQFFHRHNLLPQKRSKSMVNSYRYFNWGDLKMFYFACVFVTNIEWTIYYCSSNYLVFLASSPLVYSRLMMSSCCPCEQLCAHVQICLFPFSKFEQLTYLHEV